MSLDRKSLLVQTSYALRRIWAIARNTFVESARNRAFLGLGIASIGLVVSSLVISGLAVRDQRDRVLLDFGLFAISLVEVMIAIVLGVILVYKEIDRKTFFLVIPKPVRRWEILVGKYLGLLLVLAVALALCASAWVLVLAYQGVPLRGDMVKALVLVWMEAAVVTASAVFFSSFATPVLSGVFSLGIFALGRSVGLLQELLGSPTLVTNPVMRFFGESAVFLMPDLGVFNIGKEVILEVPVSWEYVAGASLYCLGYSTLFLALGAAAFRRKDFL